MTSNVEQIDANQAFLHVNMNNVTKLNTTNFVICRFQFMLYSTAMVVYINGSTPAPEQMVTINDVPTFNFDLYHQSSLIYSGLIGTLSINLSSHHKHQNVTQCLEITQCLGQPPLRPPEYAISENLV